MAEAQWTFAGRTYILSQSKVPFKYHVLAIYNNRITRVLIDTGSSISFISMNILGIEDVIQETEPITIKPFDHKVKN